MLGTATLEKPQDLEYLSSMNAVYAKSLLALGFAASAILNASALYQVRLAGDTLTATPGQAAKTEALQVVDSTDCPHHSDGTHRIKIDGPCTYLSALYHYVPGTPDGSPLQVTGGFSFSRKNAASYILAVARGMRFFPATKAAQKVTNPQVKTKPIPKEWIEEQNLFDF